MTAGQVDPARYGKGPAGDTIQEIIARKMARLAEEKSVDENGDVALPEDRSGRRRRPRPRKTGEVDPLNEAVLEDEERWYPTTFTQVHDALPGVLLGLGCTSVQMGIVHVLIAVAGWNIRGRNPRFASAGHRQIAQRLLGQVPERTVLRQLHGLAKGYESNHGNFVPGLELIRLHRHVERKRLVIDLLPLYEAVDSVAPGAMAHFMRSRG